MAKGVRVQLPQLSSVFHPGNNRIIYDTDGFLEVRDAEEELIAIYNTTGWLYATKVDE